MEWQYYSYGNDTRNAILWNDSTIPIYIAMI